MADPGTEPVPRDKTESLERAVPGTDTEEVANTGAVAHRAIELVGEPAPGTCRVRLGEFIRRKVGEGEGKARAIIDVFGVDQQQRRKRLRIYDVLDVNEVQDVQIPADRDSVEVAARVVSTDDNAENSEPLFESLPVVAYQAHPVAEAPIAPNRFQTVDPEDDQPTVRDYTPSTENTTRDNTNLVVELVEDKIRNHDREVPVILFRNNVPKEDDLNEEARGQGFNEARATETKQLGYKVVAPGGALPPPNDYWGWFKRVKRMTGYGEEFAFIFTAGVAAEVVVAELAFRWKSQHIFVIFA